MNSGFDSSKTNKVTNCQLGELLEGAGFVSDKAIKKIVGTGVGPRLGQVLILAGLITHEELQAALRVQFLFREKLIDKEIAIQALRLTRSEKLSLSDALQALQSSDGTGCSADNRLGQLLLDAKAISEEALAEGLAMAQCTGLPLGRILVLAGLMGEPDLTMLVHIQLLLRQGAMQRDAAIEEIAAMGKDRSETTKQPTHSPKPLEKGKSARRHISVEELLSGAGVISQSALVFSIQESAIFGKRPEETLLEHGFIDEATCQCAIHIAGLVYEQRIDIAAAIRELDKFYTAHRFRKHDSRMELQTQLSGGAAPVAFPKSYPQTLLDFLILCNVITANQRSRAHQMRSGTTMEELDVLLRIRAVSQIDVDIAALCFQCVQDSVLSLDQAIFANQLFGKAVNSGKLTIFELAQALPNQDEFYGFVRKFSAFPVPVSVMPSQTVS